jgi:hypothetical protein
MELLDKLPGIIGYVVVGTEDGSIEELKGSSSTPIGDLTAFFSSASEVVKTNLSLGAIEYISLRYGAHQLVIFPHEKKYCGVEIEKTQDPKALIKQIRTPTPPVTAPSFDIPRSIRTKIRQINVIIEEFGGQENKEHWLGVLTQGLGILGGEILPFVGIIEGQLAFKVKPPEDKEDEFIQGLRAVIDFLAKKAVEEMGSSQARVKIHAVIEKMK